MKIMRYIVLSVMAAIFACSCERDGEIITLTPQDNSDTVFGADKSSVVLNVDEGANLAITFYWNNDGIYPEASNPAVSLPYDVVDISLQFSTDEQFSNVSEYTPEAGESTAQFLVSALNNIVTGLGCMEARAFDIYSRLQYVFNGTASYSEPVCISVTPYVPDLNKMEIWNVKPNTTEMTEVAGAIYRENEESNVFEGFFNFTAGFQNFVFLSAQGTLYGGYPEEKHDYELATENPWNCWSNSTAGLSYVGMNTSTLEWWQINLPSIPVSGTDVSASLRYSSSAGCLTGSFTTKADAVALTIGGTASKFDKDNKSGADCAYTIEIYEDGTFAFKEGTTGAGALNVPDAGSYILSLDTEEMTWTMVSGVPEVSYDEFYYMVYTWSDSGWGDAVASTLHSPDSDGLYSGFITTYKDSDYSFDSKRNFTFCPTSVAGADGNYNTAESLYGTADNKYSLSPGSGTVLYAGDDADNKGTGLYLINLDLTTMTWSEQAMSPCLVGVDNEWKPGDKPLVYDSTTGLYSIEVTITTNTGGLKILLDNDWKYQLGGWDGELHNGWDGFEKGTTGTYTITVDLRDMSNLTYTMTAVTE